MSNYDPTKYQPKQAPTQRSGEYGEYKKLLYVEGTYQEQRIYYGLTDDKGKAVKCPN